MLYVKFGKNPLHGFRGDVVWKCWRTDGRRTTDACLYYKLWLRWANKKKELHWKIRTPEKIALIIQKFEQCGPDLSGTLQLAYCYNIPEYSCTSSNVKDTGISFMNSPSDCILVSFVSLVVIEHSEVPSLNQMTTDVFQIFSGCEIVRINNQSPSYVSCCLFCISQSGNSGFYTSAVKVCAFSLYFGWQKRKLDFNYLIIEPPHVKTNKVAVRPAKTQISLRIRPVWLESSLSAWRKLGS